MTDIERAAEIRGDDRGLTGLVSSAKDWHPVRGTFQLVK